MVYNRELHKRQEQWRAILRHGSRMATEKELKYGAIWQCCKVAFPILHFLWTGDYSSKADGSGGQGHQAVSELSEPHDIP